MNPLRAAAIASGQPPSAPSSSGGYGAPPIPPPGYGGGGGGGGGYGGDDAGESQLGVISMLGSGRRTGDRPSSAAVRVIPNLRIPSIDPHETRPLRVPGSRWADSTSLERPRVAPSPKHIRRGVLHPTQIAALVARMRLDELTYRLDDGDLGVPPAPERRSPSPEPVYDVVTGRRINQRDVRVRQRLAVERTYLVQDAMSLTPLYRPPPEYTPASLKKVKKLYIPVHKYPDYNFIGLIIGPRGNTQKRMERETGAKIALRGRGSVRGGLHTARRDGKQQEGMNEPLHCLIEAERESSMRKAVALCRELLRPVDDEHNLHKQQQLKELSLARGHLVESEFTVATTSASMKDTGEGFGEREKSWTNANVKCDYCGEVDAEMQALFADLGADVSSSSSSTAEPEVVADDDTLAAYEKLMEEMG